MHIVAKNAQVSYFISKSNLTAPGFLERYLHPFLLCYSFILRHPPYQSEKDYLCWINIFFEARIKVVIRLAEKI
jgi:hypothetical protein